MLGQRVGAGVALRRFTAADMPQVLKTRVGALAEHVFQAALSTFNGASEVAARCGHSVACFTAIGLPFSGACGRAPQLPRRRFIAVSVFFISIAIVSGPTPPGTGVSHPATSLTSRGLTSPISV